MTVTHYKPHSCMHWTKSLRMRTHFQPFLLASPNMQTLQVYEEEEENSHNEHKVTLDSFAT